MNKEIIYTYEAVRNSAAEMKVLANKQKCRVTG